MASSVVVLTKVCRKCLTAQPVCDFGDDVGTKDGKRGECRACRAEYDRNRIETPRSRALFKASQKRYAARTPRRALYQALRSALKRYPTDEPVTLDQLLDKFTEQSGKCALSGVEMTWSGKASILGRVRPNSVSLDRVDSSKGYTVKNVRLICYCFNAFRGDMTDEEMYLYAHILLKAREQ